MRSLLVLVLLGIISLMTLLLLAGHGPWAGHVIWVLDSDHGLNSGDLPVLALWVVGVVCCGAMLGRRT